MNAIFLEMTDSELIAATLAEYQAAKAEGRTPVYRARFEREGRTVTFPCPVCRARRRQIWHVHGCPDGLGGHREAHCTESGAHPRGYYLARPFLPYIGKRN